MIPPEYLLLCKGGEKVLLHFIQDSPGDFVPLEDISKALGISAKVKAGQRPVVRHPINIQENTRNSLNSHYSTFHLLHQLNLYLFMSMSERTLSCSVKGQIKIEGNGIVGSVVIFFQQTPFYVSSNTHTRVASSKTISRLLLHLHGLSVSVSYAHKTF